MVQKKMSVVFCGTRGIPANYGGFETAVDKISSIMNNQSVNCYVVCRENSYSKENRPTNINGINLIWVKGSKYNKLDTIVSSIQTALYLIKNRTLFDCIFWFNNANFPGIILSKLTRKKIIINTDGLEWKRAKWSLPFKAYYFFTSFLIARNFKTLISDSISIQDYYKSVFKKVTEFIPYGVPDKVTLTKDKSNEIISQYGLEKDKYFLQITRFEPDNMPLKIIEGFINASINDKYKFVLVGYKHSNKYSESIKHLEETNKNIIVLDAIYDGEIIAALRQNAFCYVHGNSVGGTNPALLEAMHECKRIMAINNGFSKEVLQSEGYYFDDSNIVEVYKNTLSTIDNGERLKERSKYYNWDLVVASYLNLALGKNANYGYKESDF
ncbi:DUF1972 domain-containing protein [Neobacillus niacini]|uniref:DUF1972 domain-containing protein n=1 Tax=Neobacillus niacini TaxID=86668 RepID=UPI003B02BE9D